MMSQLDPSVARASAMEQVVALIRQNSALEVQLAGYVDANSLQQRLEEATQVLNTDISLLCSPTLFYYSYSQGKLAAQKEVEQLREQLESAEKALVDEKGMTMSTSQRELFVRLAFIMFSFQKSVC